MFFENTHFCDYPPSTTTVYVYHTEEGRVLYERVFESFDITAGWTVKG